MRYAADPEADFIADQFGFKGEVYEVFAKDLMISEKMFLEIGNIAFEIARRYASVPSVELFTNLLKSLRERFYLHSETDDLVLVVNLRDQTHYILIPGGSWTWSAEAMPEPSSMVC